MKRYAIREISLSKAHVTPTKSVLHYSNTVTILALHPSIHSVAVHKTHAPSTKLGETFSRANAQALDNDGVL